MNLKAFSANTNPLPYSDMNKSPMRVLLAKAGLEGHDSALIAMARSLKSAGMEVIYLGIHQTAQSVARAAVEENTDAVVLTVSTGSHRLIFPAVVRELRSAGSNALVTGAADIVQGEREYLLSEGVGAIMDPSLAGTMIVEFLESWLAGKREARKGHFPKPLVNA